MNGVFDPDGGQGAGEISGKMRASPGPRFEATRDAAESADIASVMAAQRAVGPPAVSVAPASPTTAVEGGDSAVDSRRTRRAPAPSAAANPAAPAPRSSSAPGTFVASTAIDGVYTGTFGSNPDDNVTAKLYVKFIDDGSVNGTLTGLFTFDVPPSLGATPITYTYKLTGTYATGTLQFWSAKPLGKPAPDAYAMKSLSATFGRSPIAKGRNGQLEYSFNPDQISGAAIGSNNHAWNKFEAVWDKAESAELDSLMAAQAGAASAVSTTAPAAAPAGVPAAPVVRPSIVGVFNGTYTRENEGPTKFKLTVTHTRDGLAGVATIYLPTDSGVKAYTYSLKGARDGHGAFHLFVYDWDTTPPKDFKDFKAMGFNGTFLSNINQNTARIISVEASGSRASFFVPEFAATWDATESADIKGTIAAQKAAGAADEVAAFKAHAEVMKNAPPKQLASKNVVRKSPAYWDGYRSDFIREVFDGGFPDDVDDDPLFQLMFTTYVDLFSKNCRAYLPANHKTLTITTVTTHSSGVVDTESRTVEIDPRFIPKYCEFNGVDPKPGSPQAAEAQAKTIAIAGRILQVGGPTHGTSPAAANALLRMTAAHGLLGTGQDMDKFFAMEVRAAGPSAALRQLGENLLRGATDEPSLQEAGAKIDGAEAETDKDLPPGRFTHLIDAANAFYRDPANARLRFQYETAFDTILAAKYRGVMTPEEEYYYANDFAGRFRDQIMQSRANSADPAWFRLHPAVEECMKELGQ